MDIGLISIDNFYDTPDKVRDFALSCEYYPEKFSKGYPNGNAPWSGKMSKETYGTGWIDAVVSNILQKNLRQMRQIDSGSFRISKSDSSTGMFDNTLHADSPEDIYYAGVLYLSKDHDNTPGTLFYKQKSSGSDRALNTEHINDIVSSKEYKDMNKWNIHTVSNIVYNRLIIYPASKFHGPGPVFGTTDDTARIVQLFNWIDIK